MNGREFYAAVQQHEQLDWLGVVEGATPSDDEAIIGNNKKGCKVAVKLTEIASFSWDELLPVISGERQGHVMQHYTRIVGYYSNLKNWNGSKLAELADRHKGNYAVSEPAPAARETAVA